MMNRLFLISFFLISTFFFISHEPGPVSAQNTEEIPAGITNPLPGEAVQGLVQITGFVFLEEWEKFDLDFAFSKQDTWFPISTNESIEMEENLLGEWDTSLITDGNFDLRLTVYLSDGSYQFCCFLRKKSRRNANSIIPKILPLMREF